MERWGDCLFLFYVLIFLKIENRKILIIIIKNSIINVGILLNNVLSGKKVFLFMLLGILFLKIMLFLEGLFLNIILFLNICIFFYYKYGF